MFKHLPLLLRICFVTNYQELQSVIDLLRSYGEKFKISLTITSPCNLSNAIGQSDLPTSNPSGRNAI